MSDLFFLVVSVLLLNLALKAFVYACKNKVVLHKDKNINYKENKILFVLNLLFLAFLVLLFVSQIFDSLYGLLSKLL